MCVEDDQMYIMGDPFAWSRQSQLMINFMPCNQFDYEEEFCENLDDLWNDTMTTLDLRIMIEH